MSKTSVLVVEDEEDLRELIIYHLKRDGYQASGVESGEVGLEQAKHDKPDLLILDIMLPGMNGLDVCKALKAQDETNAIPIIFVSAKGEESDVIVGLELGADDYLSKPFSPKILMARVRAVLRRNRKHNEDSDDTTPTLTEYRIDGLTIDTARFTVSLNDQALHLTHSEFAILQFLVEHRGWVFTRYQIVNAVRGENYIVTERAIDVQIAGLRNKLGSHAKLIETVRGVGYRFKEK